MTIDLIVPEPADLAELRARYSTCARCPLARSRRRTVHGAGCADGGIVLVTDRVTGLDEHEGRLLSGPAGVLLGRILAAPKVEIPAERIYVSSIVLCRGPRDRMPRPAEVAACRGRLQREIALAEPRAIVALGARAANMLAETASDRQFGAPAAAEDIAAAAVWSLWHGANPPVPLLRTLDLREALWGPAEIIRRRKRIMYSHWQAVSARFRELGGVAPVESAEEAVP